MDVPDPERPPLRPQTDTDYLLRSPENARRLIAAIERLESGSGVLHELTE